MYRNFGSNLSLLGWLFATLSVTMRGPQTIPLGRGEGGQAPDLTPYADSGRRVRLAQARAIVVCRGEALPLAAAARA
ncbi:hypothetical protein [Pseudomonas zhanjiangensis]|uniref:Secreted protein n=1 Tax=Pseudomonas zhanjiangensis TaxID=3239015 RepID=A0ABV3YUH6_9PSED